MSRKMSQTVAEPTKGPTKLSAFHVGHKPYHHRKSEHHDSRQSPSSKPAVRVQEVSPSSDSESIESASSDEEADGEDGDSDRTANEDEDEDEAQDPDVNAPSDCAIGVDASQAGPLSESQMSEDTSVQQAAVAIKKAEDDEEVSNDEGYEDVDSISDSEKDGSDMDSLEERAIIDAEVDSASKVPDTGRARAISDSSESSWASFDFGDGSLTDHTDFFDEQFNRTDLDDFLGGDDNDILGNGDLFANADYFFASSPPPQRRVRFADPLLEESPVVPQAPMNTPDLDGGFPSSLRVPATPGVSDFTNNRLASPTASDDDGSGSSSGYESDCGDTTDEEDAPPSATARPQSLMRRPSASMLEESSKTATKTKPSSQQWGPRMGSWYIDPTKPLAIVDSCGKRILVCPARRPKKPDRVFEHILGSATTSANTSPRTTMSNLTTPATQSEVDASEFSGMITANPMLGAVPDLGLGTTSLSSVFPSDTDDTTYIEDNALLWAGGDDDDDDDDLESGIKMEDLIDFDNFTDDDGPEIMMDESRPASSSSAKIDLSGSMQSSSQSFLDHLDNSGVTAFRQTQLPAPASLSPQSPLKKRKLSPQTIEPSKRRLLT